MRVCAGRYKGRKLKQVGLDTTRETSDKVKQAVFNMIFDLTDQVFLDCFSGSGQIAFEALSRGAKHAYVIEENKDAIAVILENAMMLGCQKDVTFIESDIHKLLPTHINHSIDIIFMDPPYDFKISENLIKKLPKAKQLIIETHKDTHVDERLVQYQKAKDRIYGIKKITYYVAT